MKIIAGIGCTETPETILAEMQKIGAWCRHNHIWVRSGHAPGADWAFEQGAQEFCIAYLPTPWWRAEFRSKARKYTPDNWIHLYGHARVYHPNWKAVEAKGEFSMKLLARDSCQVLGKDLKQKVDFVVCWTKDGKASGGTGQALRIASNLNIPIFNMHDKQFSTADSVIGAMQRLDNRQMSLSL